MRYRKLAIFMATIWLGAFMKVDISLAAEKTFRYVITESGMPTSFDPLDADNTNNLPVARMIYATPLEVTKDNQLASRVLESAPVYS